MNIIIDPSFADLARQGLVIGIARNVDPQAQHTEAFLAKQREREAWALSVSLEAVKADPVSQGYYAALESVGRSTKKNPPTVPAFIRNIQHRGSLPHINSIVDIYNVESLTSLLSIGGHDLDKVVEPLTFTLAQHDDRFFPIASTEKHVAPTDFLYRDAQGVMAWLGVRDGEGYKFDPTTKNALFVIQGNANTSVDMRLEALDRIHADLAACMPGLEFESQVVWPEE